MQKVYEKLRSDITFGKFRPGDRLSEKLLTEEYNCSRASVREVIRQLASQGYLSFVPNRGVTVTKLSVEDINATYRILSRCESLAASMTAKKAQKGLVKRLRNCHDEMITYSNDYRKWLPINDQFHELIYINCGCSFLIDLIHNFRLRIYRYRAVETKKKVIPVYNEHHQKLILSIENKDEKLAEESMINHLNHARKNRFEVFRKFENLF